jgi:hypothetical protein
VIVGVVPPVNVYTNCNIASDVPVFWSIAKGVADDEYTIGAV